MVIKWNAHPEYIEWMMKFIPGHSEDEIREGFWDEFGIILNKSRIKNFKSRFGVRSGTNGGCFKKGQTAWNKGHKMSKSMYARCKPTMFRKGNVPHNYKPVGSERLNVDGYIEIKIDDPKKWILKQRKVWQDHYGETLKKNDVIIFLDGDRQNFDINNLYKLTRAELVRYNQDHLHTKDHDISLAAANIAKIKARLKHNDGR